jgi:chromatin segregation and condensation protein Rec8/ScpA/Scc1 (kleisin family)
MWLKSDGFVEQVQRWWESYDFQGLPSYVLANKLKALKADLKKWNAEVFGDVGRKKKELLEGINELEGFEESRGLVEEEPVRKSDMIREMEKTLLFEEINWRQKSRALWLKEGDNNTKFFHRVANSHRRYNHVGALRINGAMSIDPVDIKDHIVNYYDTLYTEQSLWRPRVDEISFSSIDADECL